MPASLLHCTPFSFPRILILTQAKWIPSITSPTHECLLLTSVFDMLYLCSHRRIQLEDSPLNEHSFSLEVDTVQFRELRAVGWRLLLPDSLTASQGVLCGGAAVSFSCLYCSLSQPCWQGLAGELAQHFSYCYVSVPGLWTACRGHTRSRVPVAVQCVVSSFT